jgi:hypothetical protein
MTQLKARVGKLEQSQDKGQSRTDWADAEVKASLFKEAIREAFTGDVNASRLWSETPSHERIGANGSSQIPVCSDHKWGKDWGK